MTIAPLLVSLACAVAPLVAQPGAQPDPPRNPRLAQGGQQTPSQQPPPAATPQQTGGPAPGSREAMWPAPTADDWRKPTLIDWQRTWEDAVAVSRETGKPLMVAVNMDGEIASEHYAGVRYRDPEVAKLFEPYVSVIASVYRHNPRDYDENGQRIPCPRFGAVTCGEHIALEPIVYSLYLDQTRVAPRHIGVELDGTELYDVFYAFDVKSVLEGIQEGIENRENTEIPPSEKDLEALVASRAAGDRVLIEERFRKGGKEERMRLLDIAEKLGRGAPPELLRLALFGLDLETARQARRILAEQRSEGAIDLILEALSVPLPRDERDMLVAALSAIGDEFPRAKILASTLRGVEDGAREGAAGETQRLAQRLATTDRSKVLRERYEVEARLDDVARRSRSAEAVADPARQAELDLERGEGLLRLAVEPEALDFRGPNGVSKRRTSELRFQEALLTAEAAVRAGVGGWRADAVAGLASHYLGRGPETVLPRVRAAYAGMVADPEAAASDTAQGWIGMAIASMVADARVEELYAAARRREAVDGAAVAEIDAIFDLLAQHPYGTDAQSVKHHDFLAHMGARREAYDVLVRGLERFRASDALHERLRGRLLWSRGVDALHGFYARQKERPDADQVTFWYSGVAGLVAGEFRRRRNQPDDALASYDSAIADFRAVIGFDGPSSDACLHYIAIALAGKASVRMEEGELEASAALLTDAFDTWEPAANVLDGLNASAVTTARTLLAKLGESEDFAATRAALAERLAALPPRLLKLPDFETPPDTPAARNRDRRGRQR